MDHTLQHNLPANAAVIANPDVWLEGDALAQLARVAGHRDCVCAVGMPDLHPGPGLPIGAAMAFKEHVLPALVGSDAGCGALMVGLAKVKLSPASLERRLRQEFGGGVADALAGSVDAVWRDGPPHGSLLF